MFNQSENEFLERLGRSYIKLIAIVLPIGVVIGVIIAWIILSW